MHTLFLLLCPSGSGKTAIVEQLEKKGYTSIQSWTTRPCRNDNGIEFGHQFCNENFYQEQLSIDNVGAYSDYGNHIYFATKDQLYSHDLYVIDKKGQEDLIKNIQDIRFVTIYLDVPESVRAERMQQRGDTQKQIETRIYLDRTEFNNIRYDYLVPNTHLKTCVEVISAIMYNELNNI